jgi:4'-phosphopantetheinyl transferase
MTSQETTRCDVWWADPSIGKAEEWSVLDDVERRACRRLRRVEDRQRCVTARALTRVLLAARIGCSAADLVVDRRCQRCGADHGKPRLVRPCRPVEFNVAHAGQRVVVAITDGAPVGVDVEASQVMAERPGLSEHVLAPTELAAYRRLPSQERDHALAVWWTRKESGLKAMGTGLAVPPTDVVVSAPGEPPAVVASPPGWPRLALHDLSPGAGYVGSVAVRDASSVEVVEHRATSPPAAGAA